MNTGFSHQATITIVGKYPPDAGKKMWKIVGETGEKFLVSPNEQQFYEQGRRYTFGYTSSDFQGRTYHTAKGNPAPADHNQPNANSQVVKAGNGNGDIDIRSILGLMHTYNGKQPPVPEMVRDLRNAAEALRIYESGGVVENIEDTL